MKQVIQIQFDNVIGLPKCGCGGSASIIYQAETSVYMVACDRCGWSKAGYKSVQAAIRAWERETHGPKAA